MRFAPKTVEAVRIISRGSYLPEICFMDDYDLERGRNGTCYRASKSDIKRICDVINRMSMRVELDEYGVPTFYRVDK